MTKPIHHISLGEAAFVAEFLDGLEAAEWWRKHGDLALPGGELAVYLQPNNGNITVIRQRGECGDAIVCIPPDQLQVLIDRLSDLFDDD
jgi:hypothetical protein